METVVPQKTRKRRAPSRKKPEETVRGAELDLYKLLVVRVERT